MESNANFDIVINTDKTFYLVESTKNKSPSMEALKKIEKILEHDMKYTENRDDGYSRLPKVELLNLLQKKSVDIHAQYLSNLNRMTGAVLKSKATAVLNKINHYHAIRTHPYTALTAFTESKAVTLSNEVILQVMEYLSLVDILNFGKVNRNCRINAYASLPNVARAYGFKGKNTDREGAKKYLMELFGEVKFLMEMFEVRYNINYFPRACIYREAKSGKVSIGKSLVKLKETAAETARLKDFIKFFSNEKAYSTKLKNIYVDKFSDEKCVEELVKDKQLIQGGNTHIAYLRRRSAEMALINAVRFGEKKIVKILLFKLDVSPWASTESGDYVLHFAAEHGDPEIVKWLLDKGAFFDTADSKYNTPLIRACVPQSNAKVMKILLKKGADPNRVSHNGRTPLMYASHLGHKDEVELLIKYGARIDDRTIFGNTALHYACGWGNIKSYRPNVEVVRFLLQKGADRSIQDSQDKTPLDIAKERGYSDIIALLLPKTNFTVS